MRYISSVARNRPTKDDVKQIRTRERSYVCQYKSRKTWRNAGKLSLIEQMKRRISLLTYPSCNYLSLKSIGHNRLTLNLYMVKPSKKSNNTAQKQHLNHYEALRA